MTTTKCRYCGRLHEPLPAVGARPATACETTIVPPLRTGGSYWWSCACGDEGGPHDSYNEAWDATVRHEREIIPCPPHAYPWPGNLGSRCRDCGTTRTV